MLTRSNHRLVPRERRVNGGTDPAPGTGPGKEDIRIDAVARTLGTATSRRQALGALLGGTLGLHGLAVATAKRGAKQQVAAEGKKKKLWCHCRGENPDTCVTLKLDKEARKRHKKNHPLDHAGECQAPEPSCPAGQSLCNGVCKDLQTDNNHCGACGNPCGAGQTCCNGVCKNLDTDENNCGTCGNACGAGLTCCGGVCKNLQADSTNCGTCGTICAAPEVLCLAGDCCKPPQLPCVVPGADSSCCTGVCLPANMGIPFHHCA